MNNLTKSIAQRQSFRALMLALAAMPLLLTGCTVSAGSNEPQTVSLEGLHGSVYGGQSPISGASIRLYAAGTTGYASTNTNVLANTSLTSGSNGTFTFGTYTCTAGQQMYIVAVGGNPGSGTNNNEVTVAALGDCNTINTNTNVQMNEVTTVAAAYALSPFATGYQNIGTDAANVAGLKAAFVNAAKLANFSTGAAGGTLPSGATAPVQTINALADVLSYCVNSTTAGTQCPTLFGYATPSGGSAPTDTFGVALNMAKYPTNNVSSLLSKVAGNAVFPSTLNTSATTDLTLSIVYTGGSFNSPTSTTVDGSGQVWVANSGNNTVSVLAQNGTPITGSPFSGNSLNNPVAIAIGSTGNALVANKGGTTLSAFSSTGSSLGTATVGTAPDAIAMDAAGNVWVANSSGNSVTELNSSGTLVQTITGITSPSAIAIDPK